MVRWLPLLLLVGFVACDDTPLPGEEGGECRLHDPPCNEGLVCNGGCVKPSEPDPNAIVPLAVTWRLQKQELLADGRDSTAVRIWVTERDTGEPYLGEVRVWVSPEGGGIVNPGRLELEPSESDTVGGQGSFAFRACNAADYTCPATAVLQVAPIEEPLRVDGTSEIVTLLGGGTAVPEGTGDPTLDTRPLAELGLCSDAGTGRATVRKDGQETSYTVETLGIDSGCKSQGCGNHWVGRVVDSDGTGAALGILLGRTNEVGDDARKGIGCGEDNIRAGRFPIPDDTGLSLEASVGNVLCRADRLESGALTPGTGRGSVYQAISCASDGTVLGGVVAWNVVCPVPGSGAEVVAKGCGRWSLE